MEAKNRCSGLMVPTQAATSWPEGVCTLFNPKPPGCQPARSAEQQHKQKNRQEKQPLLFPLICVYTPCTTRPHRDDKEDRQTLKEGILHC